MNASTAVYSSVLFILENRALEKWKYSWVSISATAAAARQRTDNCKLYRNTDPTRWLYIPGYPGTAREHRVIFFSYQRDA